MVTAWLCVGDVLGLAVGAMVLWRAPWQGHRRDCLRLALLAGAALLAFGVGAKCLADGFAMMRGLCHATFCVLLPLLALRAVRVRREARGFAFALATVSLAGETCYLWSRRVEPFRLEVTHAQVTSPRLAGTPPLRLAVVADLQTDAITAWEVEVFDRLVAAAPDLVLFAGDYLQLHSPEFERELPALQAQLRRLHPRLGSYAVGGDVDMHGADAVFAGTDVHVLHDETVALPGVPIDVIGLSRMRSRAPFVDAGTVRRLGQERFSIVLGHAPDFMLAALRDRLDRDALFVAGHTHGGQVQLPWFGPIVTLSAVPRWLAGGGVFRHGSTWLACSRGIGMEREHAPRVRFLCRPQLLLLELAAEASPPNR
jgi:predicted MPP superfamily phosphohydrolase